MNWNTAPRPRSVAAALTAVAMVGSAGIVAAQAATSGASEASTLIAITPCRLADTRTDTPIGNRHTPLGSAELTVDDEGFVLDYPGLAARV